MSSAAIHAGLQSLDRILAEDPRTLLQSGGRMLAIAEAIDPTLVPEVMWRAIAARPTSGNPRVAQGFVPANLVEQVAWNDRGIAAALLEPLLQRMAKAADRDLVEWEEAFEAWTILDPRATVARLEKVPMTSVNPNDNRLWIYVIEKLALDREDRWRNTFIHWAPIFNRANRDFMIDRF